MGIGKLGSQLALLAILGSESLLAQGSRAARPCDRSDITERLANQHPLGAAVADGAQCLDQGIRWAPVAPMTASQRQAWVHAIDSLWAVQRPECWAAAAVLVHLDQKDLVRTWTPVDTAAGKLYVGAAYLSTRAEPLGLQFWTKVFDRPLPRLLAVMTHEAYHIISPSASETEASAFGRPCSSPSKS